VRNPIFFLSSDFFDRILLNSKNENSIMKLLHAGLNFPQVATWGFARASILETKPDRFSEPVRFGV
jgi:hypothetical protein